VFIFTTTYRTEDHSARQQLRRRRGHFGQEATPPAARHHRALVEYLVGVALVASFRMSRLFLQSMFDIFRQRRSLDRAMSGDDDLQCLVSDPLLHPDVRTTLANPNPFVSPERADNTIVVQNEGFAQSGNQNL